MKAVTRQPRSTRARLTKGVLLACVATLVVTLARAQDADEAEAAAEAGGAMESAVPAPGDGAHKEQQLRLRVRLEYDRREQGDAKDSDFYGRLYGGGDDLAGGRLDCYVSARVHTDLDEKESASLADDPFRSVDDSNGVTDDRVLQLYADIHDRDRKLALRGGRQYVDIADYLHMDGAQLIYNENAALGGRVYAGHPVSYYTSVSDDYAGGVSLVGRPWEDGRVRLTLATYHDESEDDEDNHYFLDVRHQLSEQAAARGQLSMLNDEYRMARLDGYWYSPDGATDVSAGGSYWGSFDANTRVYSPLYSALGEQDPYALVYARATRQIHPEWFVSPGVSLRFAEQGDNEFNNRDYENYDVTLIYEPTRAISSSLSLEYWTVEDDDSFLGLSGEVRYRRGRIWEVSAGASFAEYTYDTPSDISYSVSGGQTVFTESGTIIEESPFVYTYFIRGKWKVTKSLILRLQFDVEDDDAADDLAYRGRGSVEVRY